MLVFFFMYKSHAGYEMRMCGLNREFSRYGGINVSKYLVLPMIMSGALHGLGGGLMVLGTYHGHDRGILLRHGMERDRRGAHREEQSPRRDPRRVPVRLPRRGRQGGNAQLDVTFEIAAIAQSFIFYFVTAQALYGLARKRRRA